MITIERAKCGKMEDVTVLTIKSQRKIITDEVFEVDRPLLSNAQCLLIGILPAVQL